MRCSSDMHIAVRADSSHAVRSGLRRLRMAVGPYWLSPSPSSFSHCYAGPTLGFSDHSADAVCKHTTPAFRALELRCRVYPQQPVSRTTAPVCCAAALSSRTAHPTSCCSTARSRQSPSACLRPSVTRWPLDLRSEEHISTVLLTGHAAFQSTRRNASTKDTVRPAYVEPAEACSTLAERGPPSTAWAETHPTLAKPTLIATRDRNRASRTTSTPSHRAAETTRRLQSRPHQLARPKPTLAARA